MSGEQYRPWFCLVVNSDKTCKHANMKLWQLEEQLQQVKPFSEAKTQLEQVKPTYGITLMSSTPQRHIWLHT